MALILNIETATALCSAALSRNGKVISQRESTEEKSHAGSLTVFIEEILRETNTGVEDLNAIAVGKGPGSYTGLRIGVSVAKGLCYGSGAPLIAINTLEIMYAQVIADIGSTAGYYYCPMIDARRMEVYSEIYDNEGNEVDAVAAKIIDETTFIPFLTNHKVVFFGSGMEKCRHILQHQNAILIDNIHPHSGALASLSEKYFQQSRFENVAYFEPFYLKDFIATVPKKVLHI